MLNAQPISTTHYSTQSAGLLSSLIPETVSKQVAHDLCYSGKASTPLSYEGRLMIASLSLKLAKKTIEILQSGTYSALDALVSDAACHVRAVTISHLVKEILADSASQPYLDEIYQKLSGRINTIHQLKNKLGSQKRAVVHYCIPQHTGDPLKEYELEIDSRLILLTKACLLGQIKQIQKINQKCLHCDKNAPTIVEQTDINKLSQIETSILKKVESEKIKQIVNTAKSTLSTECCAILKELSLKATPITLSKYLHSDRVINGRTEIAVAPAIEALIAISASQQIPIILRSKSSDHTPENIENPYDIELILQGKENKDGLDLELISKDTLDESDPVIMIDGQRCPHHEGDEIISKEQALERLQKTGIKNAIMSNAAAHPQYSNCKQGNRDDEDLRELSNLLEGLKIEGCTGDNQNIYSIKHVFASSLKELKSTQSEKSMK